MKPPTLFRSHTFVSVFFCFLSLFPISSRAEDETPKAVSFSRYQQMLDRSPFAIATAAAPLPAATPDFAKDLYIANAAHSPNGDLITLASNSDKNFKKYISTGSTVDGFGISNIEWSDKVGATKVTITKDGQFATLGFNQALLSQPLPNAPGVPPPVVNAPVPAAQPAANQPFIKPAPIPTIPTPPPHVRSAIQRNPPATPRQPPVYEQPAPAPPQPQQPNPEG